MKRLLNTLYITSFDRYLSLDGDNVVVNADHQQVGRVPLHNLDSIIAFGSFGASPALMGRCAADNRGLVFMSRSGKYLCSVEGGVSGNVLLRRRQYRMADGNDECLAIAKNMVLGKIFNSRYSLERTLRDHVLRIDEQAFLQKSAFLKNALEQCRQVESADQLRGIEGEAASVYFSVFDDMILQQKEDFFFHGRTKRPPLDRVNALLSFSYSLMASMCASALRAVGLDPYVGFLHTDRPGRESLALDLMEEFRAVICDRFVLTLVNKKQITAKEFEQREDGAVILTDDGRRTFLTAWQNFKYEELKHPFLDEKVERGMLPYVQALLLSRYIRGDLDAYPVFMWR